MKIIQVVPHPDIDGKLKTQLNAKERQLRGTRTTFYRQKAGRWRHKTYNGWIRWSDTHGGILVAEIQSKVPVIQSGNYSNPLWATWTVILERA
jgi:hypothetical protein